MAHLSVSAMINQRLYDAYLIDRVAGMGCFDWIVEVALSMHSASSRRQGLRIWFSGDTCGVPGY